MKKIILLLIVGFSVNLCIGQTFGIKNETGLTLEVGGEFIPEGEDGCSPTTIIEFGPVTVLDGDGAEFSVPVGFKVRRAGGSEPIPGDSGSDFVNVNPGDCSIASFCGSMGDFSFVWFGCTGVTIYP